LSEKPRELKNLRTHHEGKGGTKDLGGKRPLYLRKKGATAIGIEGWSSRQLSPLGRGGSTYKILKMTLELEFVKRANGMSSGLQSMIDRTLWRARPHTKRKKKARKHSNGEERDSSTVEGDLHTVRPEPTSGRELTNRRHNAIEDRRQTEARRSQK
jgi:hypothetical protein